ncbi:hypothetical protein HJ010_00500 [Vibrio parahaemolyticus]|nr:hypothetical protein [Vibrio parahaemolyticus]HCM1323114.1 hypothetical protein [Vibrio parahaemolyticus]HCM1328042.1 hypothetical protein [Vibrio parahaemolyticus]
MRYLFLFACLFSSSIWAQTFNASLMPLYQEFRSVANTPVSEKILVSKPSVRFIISNLDTTEFRLLLPNGTSITESNAAGYGLTWLTQERTSITGTNQIHIAGDNAPTGLYQLNLHPQNGVGGYATVIEQPAPQYRAMVSVPARSPQPGELFSLTIELFDNKTPAINAAIKVDILDSSNGAVLQDIKLKDDGVGPDSKAGDGVYTAITSISNSGEYVAKFKTHWNEQQGITYQNFKVEPSVTLLSGEVELTSIDSDANGLIERALFTLPETKQRSDDNFSFTLEMSSSDGKSIQKSLRLNDPLVPIQFEISAKDFKGLGEKPWVIDDVIIWANDKKPIGIVPLNFEIPFNESHLEKDPISVMGIMSDHGADSDGDGLYEKLIVDYQVYVKKSGFYGVSTDLRENGVLVASSSSAKLWLESGSNTFSLEYYGGDIGASGTDGPYEGTNFLIYPNFSTENSIAVLADSVGTTSGWLCADFIGCGINAEDEILRIANQLCDKHSHMLKAKLERIEGLSQKHPDIAARQRVALLHRAQTLARAGSCPQANGFKGDK